MHYKQLWQKSLATKEAKTMHAQARLLLLVHYQFLQFILRVATPSPSTEIPHNLSEEALLYALLLAVH